MFWVGVDSVGKGCKGLWMLLREAEATKKLYSTFRLRKNQLYFIIVRFAFFESNHKVFYFVSNFSKSTIKFSTSFRTFRNQP